MGWNPNTGRQEGEIDDSLMAKASILFKSLLEDIKKNPLVIFGLICFFGLLYAVISQPIGAVPLGFIMTLGIIVAFVAESIIENTVQTDKRQNFWKLGLVVLLLVGLFDLTIRFTSHVEVNISNSYSYYNAPIIVFGVEGKPAIDKQLYKTKIEIQNDRNVFLTSSKRVDFGKKYSIRTVNNKRMKTKAKYNKFDCKHGIYKDDPRWPGYEIVILHNESYSSASHRQITSSLCW